MRTLLICFIVFNCMPLWSLHASTSVICLDSGERLIGEVLPISDKEILVLRSALLGEVRLSRERISSIQEEALESKNKPQALVESNIKMQNDLDSSNRKGGNDAELKALKMLKKLNAPDYWSGNLRLGMNFSSGDRRYSESNAQGMLEVRPENSPHFYRFGGSYTYRETERPNGDNFKTKNKYDAQFVYRRALKENWFVQNSLSGRVDKVKGINRKVQESIGLGYAYKPSRSFEFVLGGGGGLEFYDADLGDIRASQSPLFNIFQEAKWSPLKRTSFVQGFNYYWNPENNDLYSYVMTMAVRIRLTELLGFEFSFNKTFDNDLSDVAIKDDTQWRNALVIYF